MHEKMIIDNLAYGAKWVVANLDLDQEDKQLADSIIELTVASMKLAVTAKNTEIVNIQVTARLYNLDRVVVFPCFIGGEIQLCYRMHGGYIPMFCQQVGIRLLTDSVEQLNPDYIAQMEQQYGVILYER
ncbi:MAG: hypothetical protein IIW56_09850 [Oscillospiraceae bacterium]|nr:hypothetical protein [Oscillospiraceae bacterium]